MTKNNPWAKLLCALLVCAFLAPGASCGIGEDPSVESEYHAGDFALARGNTAAPIYVDATDYPGVIRAAQDLSQDIQRVTGLASRIIPNKSALASPAVLIGTIGKSAVIDGLIRDHKVDATAIQGKWESYLVQTVSQPIPGVSSALVVAGSDKRGTIYGIYELSEQIGVSPWYWWADVPVAHRDALFIKPGSRVRGEPAVKYRGIFLNDEAPALTGWVNEKFGGYNHEFYVKVFELLLRLRANFLWPAMWNSAFNEDDPLNPKLADEYGIVMGTSHHEPMLRAQQEWKRHGKGAWDYSTNGEELREFWSEGIERNKNYESIITLGMRGDGDLPMSEQSNVELLERIVADQRKILARDINPGLAKIPQSWTLYKEVQEYYEKGMRVPDDVTLLWCDDNWGNIRRLPTAEERKRSGGAGIYYHFDYVGGPRSYKWINTNPIPKVWEQMNLAYEYGARRIWIVNVGDLKPMELPMEFLLTYARDPTRWPKEKLSEFTKSWATREFGPSYADEIAEVLQKYAKYNGRRKPELLEPSTFSVANYDEAQRVAAEWQALVSQAERIYAELPDKYGAAFFQLVLFPVKASAQVTELYIAVGKNHVYAQQGRASTNDLAAQAQVLFEADAELSAAYNHALASGKWNHMMDQTHIGYTSWNEPPKNVMPKVIELEIPAEAKMGISVEGSVSAWPGAAGEPILPRFQAPARQRCYVDLFNRGRGHFRFSVTQSKPWIALSQSSGDIEKEQRVWVSVDWNKAPLGASNGSITLSASTGETVVVRLAIFNPAEPAHETLRGFVESDGIVSMEADHFTNKVDAAAARWERIPDYGRTGSAMSIFPVTAASVTAPEKAARLEYRMYLFEPGAVEVQAILGPTLNFVPGRGLRYAVSFDEQAPQIIDALAENSPKAWELSVMNNARTSKSAHLIAGTGYHTLKFWMVDSGIVLEKLIANLGGLKPSYLGPPESDRGSTTSNTAP
jgi:Glycosyl hydrolase family 115/Gylcosyl hydrolase family 115 C-terminal domain